ncbi:hypothetical protein C0J52_24402 [Blattella germanica]|nr:hypothetical protein C0J52_24402 [Blattella germanica]
MLGLNLKSKRGEHRSAPVEPQQMNLNYYGGAEGNVLVYHPTLGLSPAPSRNIDVSGGNYGFKDDAEGGDGGGGGGGGGGGDDGGGDSVTVQLPPPGTAVVGPGGLAIARPVATAVAGVPPALVLGPGPEGPGGSGGPGQHDIDHVRVAKQAYLVGPSKQRSSKYGLMPMSRTYSNYLANSVAYNQQPVFIYPVAYY